MDNYKLPPTGEILSYAARYLVEIYEKIPEEDFDNMSMTFYGQHIVEILELLLSYAEVYEEVDIKTLFEMARIENTKGVGYDSEFESH